MADNRKKVKERFKAEGVTIADWARAHGFKPLTVYRVIEGKSKGHRGEAYHVAIALGLKAAPANLYFRLAVGS